MLGMQYCSWLPVQRFSSQLKILLIDSYLLSAAAPICSKRGGLWYGIIAVWLSSHYTITVVKSIVNQQFIFKLRFIEICIQAYLLTPTCFIVKVHILSILLTFRQLFARFSLSEPCMILFVKHPILLFQFYCCQVLLISTLLIVECKEECVQIEKREVLSAVVHGYCWE